MPHIEIRSLVQRYDAHTVVNDVSFALEAGVIACLLGPSGCGKTTLLRCIAGFEEIAGGEILIDGLPVSRPGNRVPPEARRIGMVFQDYALFPHLTVGGNVGFGLARSTLSKEEQRDRVEEMLRLVGLKGSASRYPHEMSGGQQQRIALARALAPQPALILLDEPFSNLDVDLRERLSLEVRDILKACGATAILVTHDQREAFAIADEIGVLTGGKLQQWDTPYNLYHQPANRFVADFVGEGVFVEGTVRGEKAIEVELGLLQSPKPLECDAAGCGACGKSCRLDVLLRPDDIIHDDASLVQAEVTHKAFRGAEILYTLRLPSGTRVLSLVPSHHNHSIGEKIGIRLDVDHVVMFRQQPKRDPSGELKALLRRHPQ
jgi:iron(III) transport system ATP-binding protein